MLLSYRWSSGLIQAGWRALLSPVATSLRLLQGLEEHGSSSSLCSLQRLQKLKSCDHAWAWVMEQGRRRRRGEMEFLDTQWSGLAIPFCISRFLYAFLYAQICLGWSEWCILTPLCANRPCCHLDAPWWRPRLSFHGCPLSLVSPESNTNHSICRGAQAIPVIPLLPTSILLCHELGFRTSISRTDMTTLSMNDRKAVFTASIHCWMSLKQHKVQYLAVKKIVISSSQVSYLSYQLL